MRSTFGGLEIAKRGLVTHQLALNTTGHNISNADNPNYARQRVQMQSMDPIYDPSLNRANGPGQLGQGVQISRIERIRDQFYDDQIIASQNSKNYWETARSYLGQMENVFNEPADNTLRSLTDRFWDSWQELGSYPEDHSHRSVVLERARALTTRINDTHQKLTELRERANTEIINDVNRINSIAGEIRDLNERIHKIEAHGDQANDLKDRRDAAMEKLSEFVDIRVSRNSENELIVFIGEQALVQGEIHRKLAALPDASNQGMARVIFEHNDRDVILKGGRLFGLLEMRDEAITERIDAVSEFALNIADTVNETHRNGFGLNGSTNNDFFDIRNLSSLTSGDFQLQDTSGNFDLNGDGTEDVTAVFRVTGTNQIDPESRIGLDGTLTFVRNDRSNTEVNIDYRADDTMEDVIKRINDANGGVVGYLDHQNRLSLKGTTADDDRQTNFMIRYMEDSGQLLVGYSGVLNASGEAGAFDFRRTGEITKLAPPQSSITLTPIHNPAGHIQVSDVVMLDPASIAAGKGTDYDGTGAANVPSGPGDGSNALEIAAALRGSRMIGHAENAERFYNNLISRLGTESRTAEDAVMRESDNLVTLNNLRQSVMGVSLDEEMANMVQFQNSYNAAARVINTMNEMLGVIIGLGA